MPLPRHSRALPFPAWNFPPTCVKRALPVVEQSPHTAHTRTTQDARATPLTAVILCRGRFSLSSPVLAFSHLSNPRCASSRHNVLSRHALRVTQVRRALGASAIEENEQLMLEAAALAEIIGDVRHRTDASALSRRLYENPGRTLVEGE